MLLSFENLYKHFNLNVTGIIHVGGHHGEEIDEYKKFNIEKCHFFEPVKKNFEVLTAKCVDTPYNCYNFALGSEEKEGEIFLEQDNQGQSCSILEPKLHITQYPHIKFEGKETIQIKKLDDLKIYDCNFLNADVQGYELEVLKGAKDTLHSIDYVYTEVNRDEVYKGCPMIDEITDFLRTYNFEIKMVDWSGRTWGDAFYIKT